MHTDKPLTAKTDGAFRSVDHPPGLLTVPMLDTSAFVDWCRRDRHRTYDYIRRWDILYRHCHAEYCEQRKAAFSRYYGKPISLASSIDLCLAERYTACVNFVESAVNWTGLSETPFGGLIGRFGAKMS